MKHFKLPLLLVATALSLGMSEPVPAIDGMTAATPVQEESASNSTYKLDLRNFSSLVVKNALELYYTPGDNYAVSVKTTAENYKQLTFKVENGRLVCDSQEKNGNRTSKVKLYVTAPRLSDISVPGVLTFHSKAPIRQSSMRWNVSGVLNLDIPSAQVTDFSMNVSGVCDLDELSVSAVKQFSINSSGVLKGKAECSGDKCSISMSGVGTMSLNVNCNQLRVKNSGVSKLKISGVTKLLEMDKSDLAKVNLRGLKH